MDAERLERAARALRAEALRYFTLRELLPTEGIVRAATALDEALAAHGPAQAERRSVHSERDRTSDKWRGREEIAARDHWHSHARGQPISESWLDGWLSCAKARLAGAQEPAPEEARTAEPRCREHGAPFVRVSDGYMNVYECGCRDRQEHSAPASAEAVGDAIPAMLLPLAHGLLRDANDAIDAGKGGMRPASPPKATVDAYRLRNVVAAVVAHLETQRPRGAAAQADPWAWAVLLPGNTPQQARIRMTEREATSCAAELPGFVIVPLYAAPSRPGGA